MFVFLSSLDLTFSHIFPDKNGLLLAGGGRDPLVEGPTQELGGLWPLQYMLKEALPFKLIIIYRLIYKGISL